MKRRLLLRFVLIGGLAAVGFVAYLWWTVPADGITRANAERIQKGWTEQQVFDLIGGPTPGLDGLNANNYSKSDCARVDAAYATLAAETKGESQPIREEYWIGSNGLIVVWTGETDKKVRLAGYLSRSDTRLGKLRRLLHLD